MHGPAVGIGNGLGVSPGLALAYLIVAGFLFALSKDTAFATGAQKQSEHAPAVAPAE